MKVLIFGGMGFIGSSLTEEMYSVGMEVLVCDRGSAQATYNLNRLQMNSVPFRLGPPEHGKVGVLAGEGNDIQDFENVRTRVLSFNPDVIINCAGDLESEDRVDVLKSLSEGLDNIVQARREQSVFLGKQSKLIHLHNRRDPVGHNFAAEYLANVQEQDFFGNIIVVSPAEVYGPGQGRGSRAYHNQLHRNGGVSLGEPDSHPLYIDDLCKAIVQLSSNRHNLDAFELVVVEGPENGKLNRDLANLTGYVPDTDYARGSAILTRELMIFS